MSRRYGFLRLATLVAAIGCASSSPRSETAATPNPETAAGSQRQTKTAGLEKREGFIPLYLDSRQGKLYLEIPRDSMRVLMFVSLATGLGSNPIGLDRGANGDSYVTRFDKTGDQPALRAPPGDPFGIDGY